MTTAARSAPAPRSSLRRFLDALYLGAGYVAACCILLIMVLMIAQTILREMQVRTGAVNDIVSWLCAGAAFYLLMLGLVSEVALNAERESANEVPTAWEVR